MPYKPIVLIVLDGWGISENIEGNAIKKAHTPTMHKLDRYYPLALLQASSGAVGLPWGESGNSEVGHITLGTGRIIYQNMPRINLAIQDGSFFTNPELVQAFQNVKKNNSALHLMGLIGQGSVHAYNGHLYALLDFAKREKIKDVFIHLFLDGRDSPPTSAKEVVRDFQLRLKEMGVGKIASVIGRNWAMDRNNNWDRTAKAYDMLTQGKGAPITDVLQYLQTSYDQGITDEFIEPGIVTAPKTDEPLRLIQDGDSLVFFNFRGDRARQITKAFALPGFEKFPRNKQLDISFCTFVEYEKDVPVAIAFKPQSVKNSLSEVLSNHQKTQLRISETEKYAHVTYFFNGGSEVAWPGEERLLVPSPVVPSFDQKPEMAAKEVTYKLIEKIQTASYDFILVNYANADMVGHTGNEKATIEAVEYLDSILSKLLPEVLKKNGCVLITADHGNAEEVRNLQTGQKDTEHSTNPVPFWYITPHNHKEKTDAEILEQKNTVVGLLSDVSPTILDLMEVPIPQEMFGNSLVSFFESK